MHTKYDKVGLHLEILEKDCRRNALHFSISLKKCKINFFLTNHLRMYTHFNGSHISGIFSRFEFHDNQFP